MLIEIFKFLFYSALIVVISKYILVEAIRKFAENLNLKAKTVGNIAGISTSVPELLTITTSSLRGLFGASIFNILSSNIINLLQYLGTIILNRNTSKLKNRAIIFDMILVIITIFIPIALLRMNIKLDIYIIPLFTILYVLFIYLNNSVHKLYLGREKTEIEEKRTNNKDKKNIKYFLILLFTGIALYIIGELLGKTLENLCKFFNVSEFIIGILLGVITSIPELITFFEAQKHHTKQNDEMLGVIEATNNLLTSNTVNLFVIQTIGILILSFNSHL